MRNVCDVLIFWIADGTASLLSLVKTFDSMLAVYEGFCNLKQVHCYTSIVSSCFLLSLAALLCYHVYFLRHKLKHEETGSES